MSACVAPWWGPLSARAERAVSCVKSQDPGRRRHGCGPVCGCGCHHRLLLLGHLPPPLSLAPVGSESLWRYGQYWTRGPGRGWLTRGPPEARGHKRRSRAPVHTCPPSRRPRQGACGHCTVYTCVVTRRCPDRRVCRNARCVWGGACVRGLMVRGGGGACVRGLAVRAGWGLRARTHTTSRLPLPSAVWG